MTDEDDQRPGSLTEDQRYAIMGLLMERGLLFNRHARAETIARILPGWKWAGDLGALSRRQAGDLLEHLSETRRAP